MDRPDPDAEYLEWVQQAYQKSRRTYGYRRIALWIGKHKGIAINRKAVWRLINKLNIHSVVRKRKPYKKATQLGTYHRYENVLNRDFQATRPNQKWVTDITYILTQQGWGYLSTVKDLFDGFIVAHEFGRENSQILVNKTIHQAAQKEKVTAGLILHSVDDLASAELWIAAPVSVACYFASLWLRVLRWRHLAAGIGALPLGPAYRATAIRFMVNNLFPLRLGELVGPWVVSREVGGSAALWFGTVVLERAFDMTAIMSLAIFLIAEYVDLGVFRLVAFVPMLGIVALRLWPAIFLRAGHRILNAVLPARVAPRATELLDQIAAGLAGIRDPRGLALVILHTFLLWVVLSPIPFVFAQRALGVDLGSARMEFVGACCRTRPQLRRC